MGFWQQLLIFTSGERGVMSPFPTMGALMGKKGSVTLENYYQVSPTPLLPLYYRPLYYVPLTMMSKRLPVSVLVIGNPPWGGCGFSGLVPAVGSCKKPYRSILWNRPAVSSRLHKILGPLF